MSAWIDPLADDDAADPFILAMMLGAADPLERIAAYFARPDWHADAACRGMGPALFYPEGRGSNAGPAKAVCATCPVVEPCRAAGEAETGVWGGTSERDRRVIRSSGRLRPEVA